MKKGLTMLVTAMVAIAMICVIGSAAAITEVATGTASATTAMVVFGAMVMAGVVALYVAMSQKKGHTKQRPGRLAKTLSVAILVALAVLDAKYTRTTKVGVATSPEMISRTQQKMMHQ
jgi:DMSO reductase anchor subunit